MRSIKVLWARLRTNTVFRRSARTFVYAYLGVLVPGVLGWLNDLTAWARSDGQAPFPDAHSLAYLGVAGVTAGAVAVANALGIVVENATGKAVLRTPTPKSGTTPPD